MGITIHYRGTIDRLEDTEEFENRVIDIVHVLGGQATMWRSFADHDPSRVIRGVMVDMSPGQETMSLLISPEGHIINLFEIEEAEQNRIEEPPYCWVKTQFGSLFGHIAVVHLLDALKETYFSNLSVNDEGGFFEERDPYQLARKMTMLKSAAHEMANTIRNYGMSPEAAEDPEIVLERVRRVAKLVDQKLKSTDARLIERTDLNLFETNLFQGAVDHEEPSLENQVDEQMRDYHKRLMRSERMLRHMREHQANGDDPVDAFHKALQAEGLRPDLQSSFAAEFDDAEEWEEFDEPDWSESNAASQILDQDDEDNSMSRWEENPSVQSAQSLIVQLMSLEDEAIKSSSFLRIACNGLMELMGGTVQAISLPCVDRGDRAYAIVQLHRALKGLAFFRGAVFGLLSSNAIGQEYGEELLEKHRLFLMGTHRLLSEAWEERID